jgi:hypothetical protein
MGRLIDLVAFGAEYWFKAEHHEMRCMEIETQYSGRQEMGI